VPVTVKCRAALRPASLATTNGESDRSTLLSAFIGKLNLKGNSAKYGMMDFVEFSSAQPLPLTFPKPAFELSGPGLPRQPSLSYRSPLPR
jgi:hypothetical protein